VVAGDPRTEGHASRRIPRRRVDRLRVGSITRLKDHDQSPTIGFSGSTTSRTFTLTLACHEPFSIGTSRVSCSPIRYAAWTPDKPLTAATTSSATASGSCRTRTMEYFAFGDSEKESDALTPFPTASTEAALLSELKLD
jgi:hypothetical protein